MAIGIDDLDFNEDDLGITNGNPDHSQQGNKDGDGDPIKPWMGDNNPQEDVPPQNDDGHKDPEPKEDDDIIALLLKEKNIEDPSKIKFEDEEGNIQERDWNSLSKEEQLNILKSQDQNSDDTSLGEDEIELINQLRLNQMSPQEFIDYIKQQGAAEYAQSLEQNQQYSVDDLSDDELFIVDLQSRVEDITDEEANAALERAKQDQALFEKQMKGIREEYRQIESERSQINALQKQQENEEQFVQFRDAVLDSIQSLDKIGTLDIDMDDDDMNEVANFILSTDSAGVNYLAKALDDPQTLVRMAWFALKGEEAIDSITEYFTQQIQEVSRQRYEQGFKDGKEGKKPQQKSSPVYIKPPQQEPPKEPDPPRSAPRKSIDDLD